MLLLQTTKKNKHHQQQDCHRSVRTRRDGRLSSSSTSITLTSLQVVWLVVLVVLCGSDYCRTANAQSIATTDSSVLLPGGGATQDTTPDTAVVPTGDILQTIYVATGGWLWNEKDNWSTSDDLCNYYGVTCYPSDYTLDPNRKGHIRTLDLADNHLVGTLPSTVFTLPYIEKVVVRDNGDLTVDLSQIASAQYLTELVLSNTLGVLPSIDSIEAVSSNLKFLHLTGLGLTGPFPAALYQMTTLVGLYANYNHFTGSLATTISNLFHLEELFLYDNDMTGPIPSAIGELVNLKTLSLGQNAFTGRLPQALERCTNLQVLAIPRIQHQEKATTGLTGPMLPLKDMEQIIEIDLQNQQFSGPLPSNLLQSASPESLIKLDLTNNRISGTIPTTLSSKQKLYILLADNLIPAGSLVSDFCSLVPNWINGDVGTRGCNAILCPDGTASSPEGRDIGTADGACQPCATKTGYLGATTCALGGGSSANTVAPISAQDEQTILTEFFTVMKGQFWADSANWLKENNVCTWKGIGCTADGKVNAIQLRNNDLTGTPPETIFRLPQLQVLDLSSNSITFQFAPLSSAKNLLSLDLTQTDLASLQDIGSLAQTSIQKLSIASNSLKDQKVPDALFQITTLEQLDISHNGFKGSLSTNVGSLVSLKRLYLFGNDLTGQFPTQIGNLVNLTELMAGDNNFGGSLPSTLNNLAQLEILALNQLDSQNGIGGPLLDFPGLQQLTSLQLAGNSLTGSVPATLLSNTQRGNDRIEFLLNDNLLTGQISASWATRFAQLFVDLTGNRMTGFEDGACVTVSWMEGTVGAYGCNAILCPTGTYNTLGRQSSAESICQSCSEAQYYGTKVCGNDKSAETGEIGILRDFFDATNGQQWINKDGWDGTSNDVCAWYGIQCDAAGNVFSIVLESNGLTGTPPASLFSLPSLQELNLADNQMNFLFDGIANATRLTNLNLSGLQINSIKGVGAAKRLEELHLTDNDITGTFPEELLNLSFLRRLMLNYNELEGRIPTNVAMMTNLEELYLLNNRLTGQLPATIGNMGQLKVLALAENNFAGTIPPEFNYLLNLEVLSIQREGGTGSSKIGVNQGESEDTGPGITGPLPAFTGLSHIKQLFLGVNGLSGSIPANFLDGVIDKSAPLEVDLISNRLTGELPASLVRFTNLTIYVADNEITGIPDALCSATLWMQGQVGQYDCNAILCPPNTSSVYGRQADASTICTPCSSDTSAQYYGSFDCTGKAKQAIINERNVLGELWRATNGNAWKKSDGWMDLDINICEWYGVFCNEANAVESIHLSENGLRGAIPLSLYNLESLKEINFASNDVRISFVGIGSFSRLEYIDLDYTGLKSLQGLNLATSLRLLHISGNNFNDVFPSEILSLTNLEILEMSNNKLGRYFPPNLASLTKLTILSCDQCGLEGPLPSSIRSFPNLEYLQLSGNSFSGEVPVDLGLLSNLKLLDLSNQFPSARSPTLNPSANSNTTTVSSGQVGFTGQLTMFQNFTQLTDINLRNNRLTGSIPETFLQSTNGSMLITIDLNNNQINGSIPLSWQRFENFNIDLASNKINAIPSDLCSLSWNGKTSTDGNCDHILCNIGTVNGLGRSSTSASCVACPSTDDAPFYGGTTCGTDLELLILDQLFFDLNGMGWKNDEGWITGDPVCSRFGVTCHDDTGLVKILDLHSNNLQGTVTSRIWMLTKMIELNLRENAVDVKFNGFGSTQSLQVLQLSNTNVTSLVNISQVSSLSALYVANNDMTGPLPEEIFSLTNLKSLFLNYNKFSGTLPESLDQLAFLEELYIYGNALSGPLPFALVRLLYIREIFLGENEFTGTVPSEISFLPFLEQLSFQNEEPDMNDIFGLRVGLTGGLPSFSGNSNLRELRLGSNGFSGNIPNDFLAGIANKSATITVDLSGNTIFGTIPKSLAAFSDLRIDLSHNMITGIPGEICNMTNWNGGLVVWGCDAILCPPGYYNEFGMRLESEECHVCTHRGVATYYGSTFCGAILPGQGYDEREVLKELYTATDGDNWHIKSEWMGDSSICTWSGVNCERNSQGVDRIVEISLPGNNLRGNIPSVVYYLPNLRKMNIANNVEVVMSFHDIGAAVMLEELYIGGTGVQSLEGIGQAPKLRTLKVDQNYFLGQEFPEEILDLALLEDLDLSNCGFLGTIPSTLGTQLPNLVGFAAMNNGFEGELPVSLGQLSNLKMLMLSDNSFYGQLTFDMANMTSMQTFALDKRNRGGAGLSGPLPTFSTMPGLRILDLGANSLTGPIPTNFLDQVDLQGDGLYIYLDGNVLTGTIPSELSRFDGLDLDLADNAIAAIGDGLCAKSDWWDGNVVKYKNCSGLLCPVGTFNEFGRQIADNNGCESCPDLDSKFLGSTTCPSFEKLRTQQILKDLFMATNGDKWKNKEGWESDDVDFCLWHGVQCGDGDTVEKLVLGGNNLVGSIPTNIYTLPGLKMLWLYSNPIAFSFEGIENAVLLTSLQLDSIGLNSISGIGKATSLVDVDVRFNNLKGPLPQEIGNLVKLETFFCGDNEMTGSLPSFKKNRKLTAVRLGGNKFTGPLPSFSIHPGMKSLDASNNLLSGPIPEDLFAAADASKPAYFDLSNNELSGTIPASLVKFSDVTIYLRNNLIEGIDPDLCIEVKWNSGDVGVFGCDGILCPPQTFSPSGRASQDGSQCVPCTSAEYFGSTVCDSATSSAGVRQFPSMLLFFVGALALVATFRISI